MNRAQRTTHGLVWLILAPALIGLVVWGIFARPDLTQPDPPAAGAQP